jgi:hypothetical protein
LNWNCQQCGETNQHQIGLEQRFPGFPPGNQEYGQDHQNKENDGCDQPFPVPALLGIIPDECCY